MEIVLELVPLVQCQMEHAPEQDAIADELPETALAGLLALDAVVHLGRGLLCDGPVRGRIERYPVRLFRVIVVRSSCRSHQIVLVRGGKSCRVHVGDAIGMGPWIGG